MKKYGRWIIFGIIAVGIIALLIFVGVNKNLRQRLAALLLERKVKTEIQNLRDKAVDAKARADANRIDAEEAEQIAKETGEAISKQKKALEEGFKKRGLSADEIADRFRNLGV